MPASAKVSDLRLSRNSIATSAAKNWPAQVYKGSRYSPVSLDWPAGIGDQIIKSTEVLMISAVVNSEGGGVAAPRTPGARQK